MINECNAGCALPQHVTRILHVGLLGAGASLQLADHFCIQMLNGPLPTGIMDYRQTVAGDVLREALESQVRRADAA